ncbi:glycosyl transferase [Oleiphilus sp. HI0066]|nr:glycosyl transferase [Oleiphilus sp. HI0066]
MMEFLFWLCAFLVVYIYLGYPVVIKLIAGRGNPISKDETFEPKVSILIAAFNEEKDIADTINNKLALDYPSDKLEIIVVSDESEDRTDDIVQELAAKQRGQTPLAGSDPSLKQSAGVSIRLVRQTPRAGKTSGLNLIAPQATGDILVFSDANSLYAADALRKIVANFADAEVGYVTGKMVYVTGDGSLVGDGCSSYMKYENYLREQETKVGSVVGVDGGIDAIRSFLFEQLRPDQLPDFVQPLKVTEKGYRVVYEEQALLKEEALDDSGREYNMRVRVSLRALWAMHDMRTLFNPFKHGVFAFQMLSHKLLRYLAFIPLLVCFFSNVALLSASPFYLLTLLIQVMFYALAFLGKLRMSDERAPVYLTLPYYFTLLNVACAHATWRYLKGEKQVIWKPRAG